eukprot:350809-Chlamydomonas_euryale.AAC.1
MQLLQRRQVVAETGVWWNGVWWGGGTCNVRVLRGWRVDVADMMKCDSGLTVELRPWDGVGVALQWSCGHWM